MFRSLSFAAAVAALLIPTHAPAADIEIGVVQSLTNTYAFVGVPVLRGIELAADEINDSGTLGDDALILTVADDASDRAQTVSLFSRFGADPNTLMILGPTSSIAAHAVAPVAVEHKIPMLTTAGTPEVLSAGPWVFKITEATEDFMRVIAAYAVDTLDVQRCTVLTIGDSEGFVRLKNVFRDYVRARGVAIIQDETIAGDAFDFSGIATKIAAADPDCLLISTPPEQGANLIIQLKQAGLSDDTRILAGNPMASQTFIDAGGDAVEGVYLVSEFAPSGTSDVSRAFIDAYEERYDHAPGNWAALGYTMMQVVAQAIKNAGPNLDRDRLREALSELKDVPVVVGSGRLSIDESRRPHYGVNVLVVSDGAFVIPDQ